MKVNFKNRVLEIVRKIPRGKTLSYKEVAALAGSPGAARAVGNIMKNNVDTKIPCHRVIRNDGDPGCYNNLLYGRTKEELLRKEGYVFKRRSR